MTVVQVDRSIEVVRDALVLSLTRSSRPSLPISRWAGRGCDPPRTPRGPTKEGEPSVRPPGTLTDSEEEMDSEEELVRPAPTLGYANPTKKNGKIKNCKSEGTTACIFAILICIYKYSDLK